MPLRRSARVLQAKSNAEQTHAAKRQREERPSIDVDNLRVPLADVSNAMSTARHKKSRLRTPTTIAPKTYKRTWITERTNSNPENQLRSMPLSQPKSPTVTTRRKKQTRKSLRSLTIREHDEKRIADGETSGKTSSISEQGNAASSTPVLEEFENDPEKSFSAKNKFNRSLSSSLMHEPEDAPVVKPASQHNNENRPKPSLQSLSPPPLHPEDDIQPTKLQHKPPRQERYSKRPSRPPSPPPLYPDDEIQPLPVKPKKTQYSYGARTELDNVAHSRVLDSNIQSPSVKSSIPLALSPPSPSVPTSPSSPLQRENEIEQSFGSVDISAGKNVKQMHSRSEILQPPSDSLEKNQLRQKSPGSVLALRSQTPGFRSEAESQSMYRSHVGSKAPPPMYTYSKRRQNVQDFALPTRRALGVRPRASSGGSPNSRDGNPHGSQNEGLSNEEEYEDSESEEESGEESEEDSEHEDADLVSFMGEQKRLWDEIDNVELEEDLV
ncbi:unnamed protein product [Agarophyton chilense]